jgi:hypothetical protein
MLEACLLITAGLRAFTIGINIASQTGQLGGLLVIIIRIRIFIILIHGRMIITQHFIFLAAILVRVVKEGKTGNEQGKVIHKRLKKSGINKSSPWAGIVIGGAF